VSQCGRPEAEPSCTIVFDGGYAPAENLKLIHRHQRLFFTTLKSNRLVSFHQSGYWMFKDYFCAT